MKGFHWKKQVCRFGVPVVIISDNGTQFASQVVQQFCSDLGIQQKFSSVGHPQTNGQVESANKMILKELRKRCGETKGTWRDELPMVLWSYNTMPQSYTGECTVKMLVYGEDAMIPIKLSEKTWRVAVFNEEENAINMRISLDYN